MTNIGSRFPRRALLLGAAFTALTLTAAAGAEPRLEPVFSSDLVINGVATSADGRLFLPVQPQTPGAGPEIVEVRDGKPVPYPDAQWNGSTPGMDGAGRTPGFNGGADAVTLPITLYRLAIGAKAVRR